MLKCCVCGYIFEASELSSWKESRGEYFGEPAEEELYGCPLCEGDFEEIQPCTICGEYKDGEEYCAECQERCTTLFQNLLEENFTEAEVRMLNDIYDGRCF